MRIYLFLFVFSLVTPSYLAFSQENPIEFKELGLTLTPVPGWKTSTSQEGFTLVMEEPKPEAEVKEKQTVKKDEVKFQRNITVATLHHPLPMDQQGLDKVVADINTRFGDLVGKDNFKVVEQKFFDLNKQTKGIVVFSTLTLRGVQMMQMHVIVSGSEKHFISTYMDLAKRFNSEDPGFQAAWGSMTSIVVKGLPPVRYLREAIIGGSVFGALLFLFGLVSLVRRRQRNRWLSDIDNSDFAENEDGESDHAFQGGSNVSAISQFSSVDEWSFDSRDDDDSVPISSVSTY